MSADLRKGFRHFTLEISVLHRCQKLSGQAELPLPLSYQLAEVGIWWQFYKLFCQLPERLPLLEGFLPCSSFPICSLVSISSSLICAAAPLRRVSSSSSSPSSCSTWLSLCWLVWSSVAKAWLKLDLTRGTAARAAAANCWRLSSSPWRSSLWRAFHTLVRSVSRAASELTSQRLFRVLYPPFSAYFPPNRLCTRSMRERPRLPMSALKVFPSMRSVRAPTRARSFAASGAGKSLRVYQE